MKEIWKDIKGYEGRYQISNLGRVKSLARERRAKNGSIAWNKEKLLKLQLTHRGYQYVNLTIIKDSKSFPIHRLVAMAFLPNPSNKPEVNHLNGVKTDNQISNLKWTTRQENMDHARKNGLFPKGHNQGENHGKSTLKAEQVKEIRKKRDNGESVKSIAATYGVSSSRISSIVNYTTWKHI